MQSIKNDRYLRALLRQPVDCTPVWIMRQAGRYLPEYKKIRAKVKNFISLCKNVDLSTEITLQPLQRYSNLDAVILFSDILTIPDAMGMEINFDNKNGPYFTKPISSLLDINKLNIPDPEIELSYVMDIIKNVQKFLNGKVPLIGFSGSPWTLATYMIEGTISKTFSKIKKMMYNDPKILHIMLNKLTQSIILYLNSQINSGIQSIMIFDTHGGVLSSNLYKEFSSYYIKKIITSLNRKQKERYIPITLFVKNSSHLLDLMFITKCDALGIDWTVDINNLFYRFGNKIAIQGNMDPCILYSSQSRIEIEVQEILKGFGHNNGHIFNLGHGINQDTPVNNVGIFIDAVHNISRFYHE